MTHSLSPKKFTVGQRDCESEVGITVEQFSDFVDTANADLHHLLVEQLLSVEDFLTFKAMMVKRNMQQATEFSRRLVSSIV